MSFTTIFDDLTHFWDVYEMYPKFAGTSFCFDHQANPLGAGCLDVGLARFLEDFKEKGGFNDTVVLIVRSII